MNTLGRIFRIHILGESHGEFVGIVIDGCPPGLPIHPDDFIQDLFRRKSGAKGTTTRKEDDIPEIISGVYKNKTSGSPITILFRNQNIRPSDYNFDQHPRPGHADFTSGYKYNFFNDFRGGGHFSGRLTAGIVAAGVIAKKLLPSVKIESRLIEAGGNPNIEEAVHQAIAQKDSIGAVLSCSIQNLPVGFGEPFFDSMESLLAHALFSIPGIKGIEFGSGFESARMFGSVHNDLIINKEGKTKTNHSGGINGGISNGNEVYFRLAVKPASSIPQPQETYHLEEEKIKTLRIGGRHDSCIALRMPVIVESLTACVLADLQRQQISGEIPGK